jgi:hypothetical protein
MARVNVEVYSAAGESLFWASPIDAIAMVKTGSAFWVTTIGRRKCLRLELAQPGIRRDAPSLTAHDMEVSAGIAESIAEERAVRRRVEAWAPREVTS